MPRNSRKSVSEPNPLYAIAGAGDLAVEKIRSISKIASDKIGSLETADPAIVSDRVQERIEQRADALAMTLRTASDDLRIQAKDLTDKAQAALQMALMQAGNTYDTLSERGKGAVIRMQGSQNGGTQSRTIQRSGSSAKKSSTSRSKSTTTRKRSTAKRGTKSTPSSRKSTRSTTAASSAKPRTASTSAASTSTAPTTSASTAKNNSSSTESGTSTSS